VHVTKLIAELEERGIHFRTVEDGLSTQGSTGKLILHVLGAVAQFERDLSNGDGLIELSELVAHVQSTVPRISEELNGIGRAAIAVRGSGDERQSAHFGATGGDFPVARRLR
jgi:hypothetical protein